MNRKFGIELEIAGITKEQAMNALKAVGIRVKIEGYNHDTKPHWKIVTDNSVTGGFEVVSPILEGEAGITQAEIVARALDDMGANVNGTCGFHVHFDAQGISLEDAKFLVHRYGKHEEEIDAFMPKSRRADNNQYCKSVKRFLNSASFNNAANFNQLASAMGGRYYKINLESYQRHGTIEFRQHSGTINAAKIANWVRFLAAFIDESIALHHQPTGQTITLNLHGTFAKVYEHLLQNGTVRLESMMQTFGWLNHTARSVISRMRKNGINIDSCKINGKVAYRLNAGPGQDSIWNGVSREIANFYQRRARVLALAA